MLCQGVFVFKSVQAKEGGSFINQMGQQVNYNPSFEVKFDEVDENNIITERKIKVSQDEKELVEKIKEIKPYTKAIFSFDVGFNAKGTTLKLKDVCLPEKKDK